MMTIRKGVIEYKSRVGIPEVGEVDVFYEDWNGNICDRTGSKSGEVMKCKT